MKDDGKKVIVAAADTFRAAAIEQLTEWAKRANVDIIAQQEGSDPAAVVYDAVAAAKSRQADVLICDTAGRLHNKKNLMEELKKINRIIDKEYPEAYRENSCGFRRNYRTERSCTGETIHGSGRHYRNYTYQAGWYG